MVKKTKNTRAKASGATRKWQRIPHENPTSRSQEDVFSPHIVQCHPSHICGKRPSTWPKWTGVPVPNAGLQHAPHSPRMSQSAKQTPEKMNEHAAPATCFYRPQAQAVEQMDFDHDTSGTATKGTKCSGGGPMASGILKNSLDAVFVDCTCSSPCRFFFTTP